jgi:hypothetical protein
VGQVVPRVHGRAHFAAVRAADGASRTGPGPAIAAKEPACPDDLGLAGDVRPEKTNCISMRKARGIGGVEKNPQERGTFSGVVGGSDVAKMRQLKKIRGWMAIRLLRCETMTAAR